MNIKSFGSDVWIINNTCYCPSCLTARDLQINKTKANYIKWIYFWLVKVQRLEIVLNKNYEVDNQINNIATLSTEELHDLLNELYDIVSHEETDLEFQYYEQHKV